MSITFEPALANTSFSYQLRDPAGGRGEKIYSAYDDACVAAIAANDAAVILPGCQDPEIHEWCVSPISVGVLTDDDLAGDSAPAVNMSNRNADDLLDLLGYADRDGELCGSEDADAFLGRVELALALEPVDEGVPALMTTAAGVPTLDISEARSVDCGRRPGYRQDRLHQLREVAVWAQERGRKVQWA